MILQQKPQNILGKILKIERKFSFYGEFSLCLAWVLIHFFLCCPKQKRTKRRMKMKIKISWHFFPIPKINKKKTKTIVSLNSFSSKDNVARAMRIFFLVFFFIFWPLTFPFLFTTYFFHWHFSHAFLTFSKSFF